MKLRSKFLFLVLGVTAIPFLVIAFTIIISLDISTDTVPFWGRVHTQYWLRITLPAAIDRGEIDEAINRVPDHIDLFLIGSERTIVRSTDDMFEAGSTVTEQRLSEYFADLAGKSDIQISPYFDSGGEIGYIVVKNPNLPLVHQQIRRYIAISLPILLLLFTSVMSITIIRNLDKSIVALERATGEIARGDLDFELSVRGNDQLASLTRSFNTMREKLKEEYARRARFIMGVSHDLKTPLALIEGYLDAIEDGYAKEPEKLDRYISIIKEKTALLETRILHLINFVKMNTGEWKSHYITKNLAGFLNELADRYREESAMLGFAFSSSISLNPKITVKIDPELVTRAMENLFHNAVRYSGDEHSIFFKAVEDDRTIKVSLGNKGPPIPKEEIPYIFDPFYRGSSSRRERGTGLGLATVKSLIQAHGWEIDAASGPSGVTTFTITIGKPLSSTESSRT